MMFLTGRVKMRRTLYIPASGREDPLPVKKLKGLAVSAREEDSRRAGEPRNAPPIVPDPSGMPPFEPFRFPG